MTKKANQTKSTGTTGVLKSDSDQAQNESWTESAAPAESVELEPITAEAVPESAAPAESVELEPITAEAVPESAAPIEASEADAGLDSDEEIKAAQAAEPRKAAALKAPGSCINCGQNSAAIQVRGAHFVCPACKHTWTPKEERAPFRQQRRSKA